MANCKSVGEAMPGKLLIVADDFTGACDTGVQFSKNHLRTIVITSRDLSGNLWENAMCWY